MERSAEETWALLTPADLMAAIMRRMPSVILTTIVVSTLCVTVLCLWPNRYGSDGLLFVRLGRGALAADPTATDKSAVALQESRSSEVVSVAEMLGSREIAERVVGRVGIAEINRPRNWVEDALERFAELRPTKSAAGAEMSAEECAAQLDRENAVAKVLNAIEVNVPKNGYTVAVEAKGNDPLLMQSIVQAVMDEYGKYHVQAHQASGSLEFFEKQVSESRAEALAAQTKLKEAKNQMGWMSVESGETTLRERIVKLEISLDDAKSNLAQAQSNTAELEKRLAEVEEWIPTEVTKGIASNAGDDMRGHLFELQVEESEMLAKLKPSHPRYRMLQQKMNSSKQIVDEEKKDREESTEALNPVRQKLETEYQIAVAQVAGFRSKQDALAESLARAQRDLQRLNEDAVGLANLNWQANISEQNYLQHAKSLEEARLSSRLDSQNMSDVTVIQDASLNLKKVGPPRLLLAFAGGILGLSLGLMQALLRDKKTHRVIPRGSRRSAMREFSNDEPAEREREPELVGASTGSPGLPR
jgi:uncharacterized protein involved in exopolysaccharide biosynthesis